MCRPCETYGVSRHHCRIKPTVNQISSLRDYLTDNRHLAVDTTLRYATKSIEQVEKKEIRMNNVKLILTFMKRCIFVSDFELIIDAKIER